jgi:hypothetical protein
MADIICRKTYSCDLRAILFCYVIFTILLLQGTETIHWVCALSISPLEQVFLGERLKLIKEETKSKFLATYPNISSEENDPPTDLVLIFPGSGGPDQFTTELQNQIVFHDEAGQIGMPSSSNPPRFVEVWNWTEFRGNIASAAFDGEAVGEAIAEALCEGLRSREPSSSTSLSSVRSVHSISVGGFAGHAFATRCKQLKVPYVRLTLLDPFCSRGLLGVGYGANNFGTGVDFAEHYLNTDDPVPTTNDPLPNCAVHDVTNAEERENFNLPEVRNKAAHDLLFCVGHALLLHFV